MPTEETLDLGGDLRFVATTLVKYNSTNPFFEKSRGALKIPEFFIDGLTSEEIGSFVKECAPYVRALWITEQALWLNERLSADQTSPKDAREFLSLYEEAEDRTRSLFEKEVHTTAEEAGEWLESQRETALNGIDSVGGAVYLAYADTGHYKIGCSKTPRKRIKHFDTQMPVEVRRVHTFPADEMYHAESLLHERFGEHREKGEWFDLPEEAVEYVKSIAGFEEREFWFSS